MHYIFYQRQFVNGHMNIIIVFTLTRSYCSQSVSAITVGASKARRVIYAMIA